MTCSNFFKENFISIILIVELISGTPYLCFINIFKLSLNPDLTVFCSSPSQVNPDYHPKIIGRNGAVITQLRKDFDVNVQLPKRGSEDDHIISVTGLEADAEKAKAAILKIVSDIESMDREEVRRRETEEY